MNTQSGTIINGSTDKGAYRDSNQDAFNFVQSRDDASYGLMLLVADGVGGQKDGDYAAALAAQITLDTFYRQRREGVSVETALRQAVDASNQAVHAHSLTIDANVSCTLVVAVLANRTLYTAHVGDARAYRVKEGGLYQLTADHSWVAEQVRKGVLTHDQAKAHRYKNVILKAVGNKSSVSTEIKNHGPLLPKETLILCSDGLYNTLSQAEILSVIEQSPAEHWAEQLVDFAKERAQDNVTAVTLLFPDQEKPASTIDTDTIKLDPATAAVAYPTEPRPPVETTYLVNDETETKLTKIDAVETETYTGKPEETEADPIEALASSAAAAQIAQPEEMTPSKRRPILAIVVITLLMLIMTVGGVLALQPSLITRIEESMPVRGGIIPSNVPIQAATPESTPFITSTPIPVTLSPNSSLSTQSE